MGHDLPYRLGRACRCRKGLRHCSAGWPGKGTRGSVPANACIPHCKYRPTCYTPPSMDGFLYRNLPWEISRWLLKTLNGWSILYKELCYGEARDFLNKILSDRLRAAQPHLLEWG